MKNQSAIPATTTGDESGSVHNITDAGAAHSDEMRARMIKYAIAMGIRLACFGLLFVLDGWLKAIAIAGAVFLPWVAVVVANGGSDTVNEHSSALLDSAPLAELPQLDPDTAPVHNPGSEVLQGEIVDAADAGTLETEPEDTAGTGTEGRGA